MSDEVDSEKDKGNAAFRREDYASALEHYNNAIKMVGSGAGAALFSNKAAALLKLTKYDACIQQCLKGIAAPGLTLDVKTKLFCRMATAYEAQGKAEKAMKALKNCEFTPILFENYSELLRKLWARNPDCMRAYCSTLLKQARSSGADTAAISLLMERMSVVMVGNAADADDVQTQSPLKNAAWRTTLPPTTASCRGNSESDSWESFQKRGNEFFTAGKYELAIAAFTDAIELKRKSAPPKELPKEVADLLSNRAAAYLADEKPMDTFWDCQSALFVQPGHLEATFRLAKAHANLNRYEEAKEVLEKSPHTTRPEFKAEIARLNRLRREQHFGDYDLKTLLKEAAASKTPRLDNADFNGGVEVKWISEEKGNGLVALRDFEPGDLLFAKKAFETVYKSECNLANVCVNAVGKKTATDGCANECVSRLIRRVSKNQDLLKQLYRLHAGPDHERFKDVWSY